MDRRLIKDDEGMIEIRGTRGRGGLRSVLGLCCAMAAVMVAGCSQRTIDSAQHDASNDVQTLNQGAKEVADEAKPQIDKLDLGARVTTAITANANLHGTHIRVDASDTGVRLKGTVNSAHQKDLAGDIAKQTVPAGKSVTNDLTIG